MVRAGPLPVRAIDLTVRTLSIPAESLTFAGPTRRPMSIDPRHIRIEDYRYDLPEERIARFPLAERDRSKLLVYRQGEVSEDRFYHLPDLLPAGHLLVMNNTRVIQARLHLRKATGALIEVFCLEPAEPADYALCFQQTGHAVWHCLIGNLKKWKDGPLRRTATVRGREVTLTARRGAMSGTSHQVDLSWDQPGLTMADILEAFGELPIPPYLGRAAEESDKRTYQTVYSKVEGSVAAPTAGLHFTPEVLERIRRRGIDTEEVTLHVGAGTFKPVKSEEIAGHEMHTEHIAVGRNTLQSLIAHGGRAIAVGTTSVRTLESLYHLGADLLRHPEHEQGELHQENGQGELHLGQWEAYDLSDTTDTSDTVVCTTGGTTCHGKASGIGNGGTRQTYNETGRNSDDKACPDVSQAYASPDSTGADSPRMDISPVEALEALVNYMDRHGLDVLHATTQIIIAPGYRYRVVEAMVTNLHQPQSTLLLLVSAFVHGDWRRIYDYALAHDFRFLSYGDACLLVP